MSAYTESRSERLNSRWSTVDSFLSNLRWEKGRPHHLQEVRVSFAGRCEQQVVEYRQHLAEPEGVRNSP